MCPSVSCCQDQLDSNVPNISKRINMLALSGGSQELHRCSWSCFKCHGSAGMWQCGRGRQAFWDMTLWATGRNVCGNVPNWWCWTWYVCSLPRCPVSFSLCLFPFPLCWMDLSLPVSSLPQQRSPFSWHTLPTMVGRNGLSLCSWQYGNFWPSAMLSKVHPPFSICSKGHAVEQSSVHMQGRDEEPYRHGLQVEVKNPRLLTTPLGPGCVCGGAVQNPAHEHQQQANLWPFWKEDRAHLTQTFLSPYGI